VRTGPPLDDDEDLALGVWAGVVPLDTVAGTPIPAPDLTPGLETDVPGYALGYHRGPPG
jgi:hypothetical protein